VVVRIPPNIIQSIVFDNCIIEDGGVIKQPNGDASTKEKGETQSSENILLSLDAIFGRWLRRDESVILYSAGWKKLLSINQANTTSTETSPTMSFGRGTNHSPAD
jgi:hypothetical protein